MLRKTGPCIVSQGSGRELECKKALKFFDRDADIWLQGHRVGASATVVDSRFQTNCFSCHSLASLQERRSPLRTAIQPLRHIERVTMQIFGACSRASWCSAGRSAAVLRRDAKHRTIAKSGPAGLKIRPWTGAPHEVQVRLGAWPAASDHCASLPRGRTALYLLAIF